MDDNEAGWKVLQRARAKKETELSEAEQLFSIYCYPQTWYWEYWEWKQAALDILSSGIFQGDELKGHARRQNYPVVQGGSVVLRDLIIDLVQKHFDYDVNLPAGRVFHRLDGSLVEDIVGDFDDHFCFVSAIARLGGIRRDLVKISGMIGGSKYLPGCLRTAFVLIMPRGAGTNGRGITGLKM
jgi:hypothetical protein